MSDTASSIQAGGAARGDSPAPLTPDRIDAILADFRRWLEALGPDRTGPAAPTAPERVDLFTLVGQFTALRHEVNMQTKATRAATEQSAEALKHLSQPRDETKNETDDATKPMVKALIDIADSLQLSMKQVERAQAAATELLGTPGPVPRVPPRGIFAKLFGRAGDPPRPPNDSAEKLRPLLASVADGYALSLRRVERLFPECGLEPFECVGDSFDPELMEVLEVVEGAEQESGTVVDEVRRGYLWNGKLFRFALVKVAR